MWFSSSLGRCQPEGGRGIHQRLAHLLVPLGLRCCSVFSYLGISNLVQTLQGEGCGSPCWLGFGHCEIPVRQQGKPCCPWCLCSPPALPALFSRQDCSGSLIQAGTGWGLPLLAALFLSPSQIKTWFHQCLLGIGSYVGWVWRCKVSFVGCCELIWLGGCFTVPWCQACLDWYCLERPDKTEAGTLTAWQYFGIWLQSPTLPTQRLEAAGQIHGLRDLGLHSTSLLRFRGQVRGLG